MSEKLNLNPEQHEVKTSSEHHKPHHEQHETHKAEKDPARAVAEARQAVHETVRADNQPGPKEKLQAAEKANHTPHHSLVNKELKQVTLRRELQHIRRKLSAPDRALSKVIHQPIVRAVSEAAGKTVSRPSGLLGGGLVALLGTSVYLYLAKHIGFEYNYGVFLILFAVGFVVGVLLELAVHAATASRRRIDT